MKENRSVKRILAILDLLAKHEEGLTLGQIYRMLDIPKATAYDFLQTLYQADAIYYKDPRLKNYVIGSKMFGIGSVYIKNSNLIEAGQFELKTFAEQYGRTVFITKRINEKIVYVHKYQPSNSKIVTPEEIGSISFNYESHPVGQCYAKFDRNILNKYKIDPSTDQKKYIFNPLNSADHICTLAIPIWNFENRVCGVISASDLAGDGSNREQIAKDFLVIAEHISKKLGYLGHFYE